MDIRENQRRAVNAILDDVYHKGGDFIEVTEWSNGEGYDITVSSFADQKNISLHFTEWKVIKKLIKHLDK